MLYDYMLVQAVNRGNGADRLKEQNA